MSPDIIIPTSPPRVTNIQISEALETILSSQNLCSIATANKSCTPHVNTCFFSYTNDLRLFIFTSPSTQHSENISSRADCAINIFSSTQVIGEDLAGVQLFGRARQLSVVEAAVAFNSYCARYPILLTWATSWDAMLRSFQSRFFEIDVSSGKVLYEKLFGKETYVLFKVNRT
jgi:uncharacterized protein YhbP (UPF0306 family)